jgi:hypothetical protein
MKLFYTRVDLKTLDDIAYKTRAYPLTNMSLYMKMSQIYE